MDRQILSSLTSMFLLSPMFLLASMSLFSIIKVVGLAILFTLAVLRDLNSSKIPNRYILAGIIFGFAVNIVEGLVRQEVEVKQATLAVLFSVLLSVLLSVLFSILIPFFSLAALYKLKMFGAGDVKLFMSAGAIVGTEAIVWIMAYSFLAGGFISLLVIILNRQAGEYLRRFWRYIKACFLQRRFLPYGDVYDTDILVTRMSIFAQNGGTVKFSVAIAAGALIFTVLRVVEALKL